MAAMLRVSMTKGELELVLDALVMAHDVAKTAKERSRINTLYARLSFGAKK